MKDYPLKIEDCEQCRWNFGNNVCGIFSAAADLSEIAEQMGKQTKILEQILKILAE